MPTMPSESREQQGARSHSEADQAISGDSLASSSLDGGIGGGRTSFSPARAER